MQRLLALVLLCLCLTLPARAQEAPSAEALGAAQNLMAVLKTDIVQPAFTKQLWAWGIMEGQLSGKVDAATLTELRSEFERLFTKFETDTLKDTPALFARHFTAAEMNDMIAFYKTPTGAKALREMSKVRAEIFGLVATRLPLFQQDETAMVEAVLKKHGYSK